jgi:hypothetical protein
METCTSSAAAQTATTTHDQEIPGVRAKSIMIRFQLPMRNTIAWPNSLSPRERDPHEVAAGGMVC